MAPHQQLDKAMNDRRLQLRMTWNDLAKAAGISDVTLRAIRRGDNQPSPLTRRRIEDALQWTHGSIEAVLADGEPTPIEQAPADEREPTLAELRAELEAQRERNNRLEERIAAIEAREHERQQQQRNGKTA